VSRKATRKHLDDVVRALADDPQEDPQPGDEQDQIDQAEQAERGPDLAGGDHRRDAVGGAQQPLDDPGLPPHLGGGPAHVDGDEGEREAHDQQPQQPARLLEALQEVHDERQQHHPDEHERQGDHQMVALEGDLSRGPVGGRDAVESRDHVRGAEAEHQAQAGGDAEAGDFGVAVVVAHPAEQVQGCVVLRVVERLERRHLHRLILGDFQGVPVTDERHGGRGEEPDDERGDERLAGEVQVALLEQVPGADTGHDEASGDDAGHDGVHVARREGRVEGGGPEAGEDGPAVFYGVAGRSLLPGIGDEDPHRRQQGPDHDEPRRGVVEALGDLLAAEQQHAEEGRLEEEGEKALGCQRRPEDAAHEARVVRPVGAEGELHGDPGGDPDGERGREELDPEVRGRLVGGNAALEVAPLGEHDH
jgi:hypothetical protein